MHHVRLAIRLIISVSCSETKWNRMVPILFLGMEWFNPVFCSEDGSIPNFYLIGVMR